MCCLAWSALPIRVAKLASNFSNCWLPAVMLPMKPVTELAKPHIAYVKCPGTFG